MSQKVTFFLSDVIFIGLGCSTLLLNLEACALMSFMISRTHDCTRLHCTTATNRIHASFLGNMVILCNNVNYYKKLYLSDVQLVLLVLVLRVKH